MYVRLRVRWFVAPQVQMRSLEDVYQQIIVCIFVIEMLNNQQITVIVVVEEHNALLWHRSRDHKKRLTVHSTSQLLFSPPLLSFSLPLLLIIDNTV